MSKPRGRVSQMSSVEGKITVYSMTTVTNYGHILAKPSTIMATMSPHIFHYFETATWHWRSKENKKTATAPCFLVLYLSTALLLLPLAFECYLSFFSNCSDGFVISYEFCDDEPTTVVDMMEAVIEDHAAQPARATEAALEMNQGSSYDPL